MKELNIVDFVHDFSRQSRIAAPATGHDMFRECTYLDDTLAITNDGVWLWVMMQTDGWTWLTVGLQLQQFYTQVDGTKTHRLWNRINNQFVWNCSLKHQLNGMTWTLIIMCDCHSTNIHSRKSTLLTEEIHVITKISDRKLELAYRVMNQRVNAWKEHACIEHVD